MYFFKNKPRRIYLDYAAATPVAPAILKEMLPYFSETYANPSAIHAEGQRGRAAVEAARHSVARLLKIRSEDVTFTSGGTEANNLALFGVIEHLHRSGRAYEDMEIVSTAIEHPSILVALDQLALRGVTVRFASLQEDGRIRIAAFEKLLSEKTVLVSCAYANSEIGVVQEVKRISRSIRSVRGERMTPFLHIDASQAPLWLPCEMDALGADLMTLDAGKCYGPKGVGVLAHRKHTTLAPQLFGGDQEGGLRPGTENVPLIVGCAAALLCAQRDRIQRVSKITALRELFFSELEHHIPEALVNGSRTYRIANNVNVSIPGLDAEFLVVSLDVHGIAAATRSACAGASGGGSHVVRALSGDEKRAASTLRFTLGAESTSGDVRESVRVLAALVRKSTA